MKITLNWLEEKDACSPGMEWWKSTGLTEIEGLSLVKRLMAEGHHQWANWLIVRLMGRRGQLRYACYAARLALPVWEKEHPNDIRPRLAIEAAEKCINHDTPENRHESGNAAWAARDAAENAARNAAETARDAARDAAENAAWNAAETARAARDAAWEQILGEGIKILEKK